MDALETGGRILRLEAWVEQLQARVEALEEAPVKAELAQTQSDDRRWMEIAHRRLGER